MMKKVALSGLVIGDSFRTLDSEYEVQSTIRKIENGKVYADSSVSPLEEVSTRFVYVDEIKLKGLSKKRYDMSELVKDAYRHNSIKISILAATVELLAKGTQHQKDAEEIIKGCYPQYYKD